MTHNDLWVLLRIRGLFKLWNMHAIAAQILEVHDAIANGTITFDQWEAMHKVLRTTLSRNDSEAAYYLDCLDEMAAEIQAKPEQLTLF